MASTSCARGARRRTARGPGLWSSRAVTRAARSAFRTATRSRPSAPRPSRSSPARRRRRAAARRPRAGAPRHGQARLPRPRRPQRPDPAPLPARAHGRGRRPPRRRRRRDRPPTKSRRGEPSLLVDELELLAPIRSPLPDTFHGLTDVEQRYRRRYLDLLMNEETRADFILRSRMVAAIRALPRREGFVEVETPVLQPRYGGAFARAVRDALTTSSTRTCTCGSRPSST